MAVQVTCVYTINPTNQFVADLLTPMAAVVLDRAFMQLNAVTVISDVTANVAGIAMRTIVLSFTKPPFVSWKNPQLKNFTGSIVSKSDADKAGGVGAQQVQLTYLDEVGAGPFNEVVNLNGKTPVNLANNNKASITDFTILAAGTLLANKGRITLFSKADLQGDGVGFVPESQYTLNPSNAKKVAAFQNWMKERLQYGVGTPVIAQTPVLA